MRLKKSFCLFFSIFVIICYNLTKVSTFWKALLWKPSYSYYLLEFRINISLTFRFISHVKLTSFCLFSVFVLKMYWNFIRVFKSAWISTFYSLYQLLKLSWNFNFNFEKFLFYYKVLFLNLVSRLEIDSKTIRTLSYYWI